MRLSLEQLVTVAAEVKSFDTDLNFSNEQRQILQEFLRLALEQIEDYKVNNPQSSEAALSRTIAKPEALCASEWHIF